jgi:hypothetical protein
VSYYAEDTCDVYDERRITARKDHECDACDATIAKGLTYWRIGILFDGRWEAVKRCERCQAVHVHLRVMSELHTEGELWPDERLNCGMVYEDEWGPMPDEAAALAFMGPGDVQAPTYDEALRAARVEGES